MGWMMVMFDLPTVEKEHQRLANRFREGLLELGFFMLQESVYTRNCVSFEKYPQYSAKVESIAPEAGLVNIFFITDRQWLDSKTLCLRKKRSKRGIDAGKKAAEQLTFW